VDVGINHLNELLNRGALPVPRIEQFGLESTEEAFAGRVVRRSGFARHRAREVHWPVGGAFRPLASDRLETGTAAFRPSLKLGLLINPKRRISGNES